AVDRLRALRDAEPTTGPLVLAATDPAQPYGAALPWPDPPVDHGGSSGGSTGRASRAAGAYVVLVTGEPCAYLERGGKSLLAWTEPGGWVEPLVSLVKDGRLRRIELQRVNGAPARESPVAPALRAAGFVDAYRGLTFRGA